MDLVLSMIVGYVFDTSWWFLYRLCLVCGLVVCLAYEFWVVLIGLVYDCLSIAADWVCW